MTAAARVLSAQDHLNALMAATGPRTLLAATAITERLDDKRAGIWCPLHKHLTTVVQLHKELRYGRHGSAEVKWATREQLAGSKLPHIDDCWRNA